MCLFSSSDSSGYGLASLLTESRYLVLPPALLPVESARRRGSLWLLGSGEARGLGLASRWAGDDCLEEDAEEEVLRRLGDGVSASISMTWSDRVDNVEYQNAGKGCFNKRAVSHNWPAR